MDDLVSFIRGPGFVLDFSDKSFAEFFASEIGVEINHQRYQVGGSSKGKRLRHFLQICDDATAIKLLTALWEHRTECVRQLGGTDPAPEAQERFNNLLLRLGNGPAPRPESSVNPAFDHRKVENIKKDLLALSSLQPQARGYAFETFLKELFNLFRLEAHDPFRLRGEQIDGSFQLGSETYLLEAKWIASPTGAGELHTFHGKIEQKSAWTRGLFVSNSGFTEDGLFAFGRGKRVICMDGLDLYDMLERKISLIKVLESKVRRAAETGSPFVRVRDIFPNK